MKVLHVYRGYGDGFLNPVVDNQINSLSSNSDEISIITYKISKGGFNYLKEVPKLHRFVKKYNNIDLIHAHYSFSGFLAILSFLGRPVVCSLMGSDVLSGNLFRRIIKFFNTYLWSKTIVKSNKMRELFPNTIVIPNGVDFENFCVKDLEVSYDKTGFDRNKINIVLIATDLTVRAKNVELAEKAIKLLGNDKVVVHKLSSISFEDLPYYYSCANLLLLTSFYEGSPNVIKEAMACNCPIVSTDVGDVKSVIADTDGCYITSFDHKDVANKIQAAIKFGKRTNGRGKISYLDNIVISKKLIELYKSCIK